MFQYLFIFNFFLQLYENKDEDDPPVDSSFVCDSDTDNSGSEYHIVTVKDLKSTFPTVTAQLKFHMLESHRKAKYLLLECKSMLVRSVQMNRSAA